MPGILTNQTVLKGSPIKLSCRVSTEEMFPVKWLKKVDMNKITEPQPQLSFLQIGGEKYKVILHRSIIVFGIKRISRFSKYHNRPGSFSQKNLFWKTRATNTHLASSQQKKMTLASTCVWCLEKVNIVAMNKPSNC
jgi:hypothetical protein